MTTGNTQHESSDNSIPKTITTTNAKKSTSSKVETALSKSNLKVVPTEFKKKKRTKKKKPSLKTASSKHAASQAIRRIVIKNVAATEERTWKTLLHHGVVFPRRYLPHGVALKYDGESVALGPCAEEVASMYAKVDGGRISDYAQFSQNVFAGLRRAMRKDGDGKTNLVRDFSKCDFSDIFRHVRKFGVRYEKETAADASLRNRCRVAIVDGNREIVFGFEIPEPRIMLGPGEKAGMVKDRVLAEEVTINIGDESPVPECPVEGAQWGRVIHEPREGWVAFWMDSVYGDEEYAELTGYRIRQLPRLKL